MTPCYCGSSAAYANCCQPIHQDHKHALTPEQLMRARYSAHVLGLVDFVVATYHPSCHAESQRDAIAESVHSDWQRLDVISASAGSHDQEGFVHFKAYLCDQQQELCLEERSRFLREEGLWYYVDGEFPQQAPAHKVGRNDPCPCGSGKKFKKCCGQY
ncbi:YchJ family metal-binding protein [Vibrio sp. CJQ_6]|uniref:YchJ family metal-binding protein n=1 Tax=Vibrio sp. CJQ_6 TaxID=3367165 RepID=UPI00370BCFBF